MDNLEVGGYTIDKSKIVCVEGSPGQYSSQYPNGTCIFLTGGEVIWTSDSYESISEKLLTPSA
ncbi:hypothetical protein LCGC14_1257050 [marine sediment metagenome]|uniref:Uncharacterized protein n=1 Tax=marine sediment metagenome TaxID=412755 RepID=A0A0F9L4M8_9ZZZZ